LNTTIQQYDKVVLACTDVFLKKNHDYGTSWQILRASSLTDQIFIKAQRIRTVEESGLSKVEEGIEPEFVGIVNYSIFALIQLELGAAKTSDQQQVETLYKQKIDAAKELMLAKNHDYGEAWRDMRVSSFTDLILMKILRIKQIEDNKGKTLASEGIDANFYDIINYAIFALIKPEKINNKPTKRRLIHSNIFIFLVSC